MEYALFERELQGMSGALGERKNDVHGVNARRKAFNEREKDIRSFEDEIKRTSYRRTNLSLSKCGFEGEIDGLVRARMELEFLLEDLKAAKERTGGKKEEMEAEPETVKAQVVEKEEQFDWLLPEWDAYWTTKAEERIRLDDAQAHLHMLQERQGRLSRFRTRQECDRFPTCELQSLRAFRERQGSAPESVKYELENAWAALAELGE